jgi:hypothetical protein
VLAVLEVAVKVDKLTLKPQTLTAPMDLAVAVAVAASTLLLRSTQATAAMALSSSVTDCEGEHVRGEG